MKDIAIVYMVAGLSSRFEGKIKQFVKIGPDNESLIEYSVNQALKAGFTKIIFIVGEKTEKGFKEMFGNEYNGVPVYYALQKFDETRDRPWGTVDALCSLENIVNCGFVICNGDDIYGENRFKVLLDHLKSSEEEATIGTKILSALPEKGSNNRGLIGIKDGYVNSIREIFDIEKDKLAEKNLTEDSMVSSNIFSLHPGIIELLKERLRIFKEEHEGDRRAECLLPEELSKLLESGKIKMKFYSTVEKCYGVTNPGDELDLKKILEKK